MTTRTTSKTVTFKRPFVLKDFAGLAAAGDYVVDTREEQVDSMLSPAWRRVSTVMRVREAGAVEYREIDPAELHEALMRDGAQDDPGLPPSPGSAKGRYDRARKHATSDPRGGKSPKGMR